MTNHFCISSRFIAFLLSSACMSSSLWATPEAQDQVEQALNAQNEMRRPQEQVQVVQEEAQLPEEQVPQDQIGETEVQQPQDQVEQALNAQNEMLKPQEQTKIEQTTQKELQQLEKQAQEDQVVLDEVANLEPRTQEEQAMQNGMLVEDSCKSAFSEDTKGLPPVSLTETLERTYMQNADLDSARAGLRSTVEDVSQAVADWRPSLSVRGSQGQTKVYPIGSTSRRAGIGAHGSNTQYTAQISQNVYRGGQTIANVARQKSTYFGGKEGLFSTEQQVMLNAIQAHTNIHANEQKLNYQRESEDFYRERVEQTKVRFEVGEGSRTDVETMKAGYEESKANVATALANLDTSKANYLRQVGNTPGKIDPPTVLLELPNCYEDALEVAKKNNPLIKQARYTLEAAVYFVNVRFAGLLPTVDVGASVGNSRVGNSNTRPKHIKRTNVGFEATVDIPLYAQGLPNSQVRQAWQLVSQSKVDLINTERQVVEDTTVAWENLIAARENVKSRIAQVKAQELAVEGATIEAEVGQQTFIDVRQLQQELISAQINLVDAQVNLIVASYAVLQAMGRLTACDLKLNVKYYNPDKYYNEYKEAWIQFWKGKDWSYVKEVEYND